MRIVENKYFIEKDDCVKKMTGHLSKRIGSYCEHKVGLSLYVWPSRKDNIGLVLNLLYKRNPSVTTALDGSIFKKIFKTCNLREMLEGIIFIKYYIDVVENWALLPDYWRTFLKNFHVNKIV